MTVNCGAVGAAALVAVILIFCCCLLYLFLVFA